MKIKENKKKKKKQKKQKKTVDEEEIEGKGRKGEREGKGEGEGGVKKRTTTQLPTTALLQGCCAAKLPAFCRVFYHQDHDVKVLGHSCVTISQVFI